MYINFIRNFNTPSTPLPPAGTGNTGIVPPWLTRDLGHEATQVTNPAHAGWRIILR